MKHSFMHHSRFESKKARIAKRSFIYGVMTISTIVISTICLLLVLGYRFDRQELTFQQGGLIQFATIPNNAAVYIDEERDNFNTPGKSTYPAGSYDIRLTLKGYDDWRKKVRVDAGSVLWLNYARFVPSDLTTETIQPISGLSKAFASPERRFIAMQTSVLEPKISIANIRNADKVEFSEIEIPVSAYTPGSAGDKHEFKLQQWSGDGRYLLVYHRVNDTTEYIRVDREQPQNSVNVSSFHPGITSAIFAENNGNRVYALQNKNLKLLDASSSSSRDIVENVLSYKLGRGGTVAFAAQREDQLEIIVKKNDDETTVKTFSPKTNVKFDVNNYYGDDYLAMAYGNTVEVFRDPLQTEGYVKRFTTETSSVEWLDFSASGRMLMAQKQASVSTYDLELDQVNSFSFDTEQKISRPFQWLDNYYLWADFGGDLRMFEYDGTNQHVLAKIKPGFAATLSENGKFIYSFGGEAISLQRTSLTAKSSN